LIGLLIYPVIAFSTALVNLIALACLSIAATLLGPLAINPLQAFYSNLVEQLTVSFPRYFFPILPSNEENWTSNLRFRLSFFVIANALFYASIASELFVTLDSPWNALFTGATPYTHRFFSATPTNIEIIRPSASNNLISSPENQRHGVRVIEAH
jgi:hypothetical protein